MRLDAGLVVDQRRAEHALQGAQQTTVDVIGIVGNRPSAEIGAIILEIEEHRAWHGDLAVLQRDEFWLAAFDEPDG